MNLLKRITILTLLVALASHATAALTPKGEADACESDCCASAHQMAQAAIAQASGAGLCCVIECPPDAEVPPLVALNNPSPQPSSGIAASTVPTDLLLSSLHAKLPFTPPPRYLRDSSSRYLRTGAFLI